MGGFLPGLTSLMYENRYVSSFLVTYFLCRIDGKNVVINTYIKYIYLLLIFWKLEINCIRQSHHLQALLASLFLNMRTDIQWPRSLTALKIVWHSVRSLERKATGCFLKFHLSLKKLLQFLDQTVESPRSFQPYWESSLKVFDSLLIMFISGWRKVTKNTLWDPEFKNWSWLHSIVVYKTMWLKIFNQISHTPTELRCSRTKWKNRHPDFTPGSI